MSALKQRNRKCGSSAHPEAQETGIADHSIRFISKPDFLTREAALHSHGRHSTRWLSIPGSGNLNHEHPYIASCLKKLKVHLMTRKALAYHVNLALYFHYFVLIYIIGTVSVAEVPWHSYAGL